MNYPLIPNTSYFGKYNDCEAKIRMISQNIQAHFNCSKTQILIADTIYSPVPSWCKYLVVRRSLENFRENLTQQPRTNIHKKLLKHRSKLNPPPSRYDVDTIQYLKKTAERKVKKIKSKREGIGKERGGWIRNQTDQDIQWWRKFYFKSIVYMSEGGFYTEMEFFLMFQSCKSGFKVLFTVGTLKWFILRVKDHMLF